jgi:Zn finger protein HypA/HybF involved in hydrogenase expression
MHEVSLVAELVEACERAAAGATIRTVCVRHVSAIPEDAVRQAFELLTTGTPLAAARLDLTSFDIEVQCPCGFVGRPDHDALDAGPYSECPSCGSLVRRPATAELELVAVVT